MSLPFHVRAEDIVVTPDCILKHLGKQKSVIFLSSLTWHLNQTMRICLYRERLEKEQEWFYPLLNEGCSVDGFAINHASYSMRCTKSAMAGFCDRRYLGTSDSGEKYRVIKESKMILSYHKDLKSLMMISNFFFFLVF